MNRLSRLATGVLSTALLGLVIAGCKPQGEAPATDEAAVEDAAVDAPAAPAAAGDVVGGAAMHELFAGNTITGVLDAWNLRWTEYFAPDGTAQAVLKPEGQADQAITGTYYVNDHDQFCTDHPELDGPNVFCSKMVLLDDGTHQQVYADGTMGAIYTRILEGEQLDALD